MKLATIAAILGVASTAELQKADEALIQEAESMEEMCKDMGTIDEESLVEAEEEVLETKNIKNTYKKHYNKSKK